MKIMWLETLEVEIVDDYEDGNIGSDYDLVIKKGEIFNVEYFEDFQFENINGVVNIQFFDNQFIADGSLIFQISDTVFEIIEGKEEETPEYFNKITEGYVIQNYKRLPNGTTVCIGQEFKAIGDVHYEDNDSKPVNINTEKEVYCPFEMEQPKPIPSTDK